MTGQKNHLNTTERSDPQGIRRLAEGCVGTFLPDGFQIVDGVETAATDHPNPGGIKLLICGCWAHGLVEVRMNWHLPSMTFWD